jgi:hypothetical protein
MNEEVTMGSVPMLGGLSMPAANAEAPKNVRIEVGFLLGHIEQSGCRFYRNGTWHDSKVAQSHLRDKYNYLAAGNRIDTTEDFIEKAATASSLSGQPYQVKCNGNAAVTSSQWLRDALVRLRASR